jgi:hypothetical protein
MGYRLFKILAVGCGKAKPQFLLCYQVTPGKPEQFQFVYPNEALSDMTRLLNLGRPTAVAATCRNLHFSVLRTVLNDIFAMDRMIALRFDQCDLADILNGLKDVAPKDIQKITQLSLDNTNMTWDQFVDILSQFKGLKKLSLNQVELIFPLREPQKVLPHTHLKELVFSPLFPVRETGKGSSRFTTTVLKTLNLLNSLKSKLAIGGPDWLGGMLAKLFPGVTTVDLTSFPVGNPNSVSSLIRNFTKVPLKATVTVIIGKHPVEDSLLSLSTVQIQREKTSQRNAWDSGKFSASSA